MPTNRTKRSRSKQGLDYWKIDQLVTGSFLLAGVGYAAVCHDGWNHWSEEDERRVHELMRTDWALILWLGGGLKTTASPPPTPRTATNAAIPRSPLGR
jgi:hypothetical protein